MSMLHNLHVSLIHFYVACFFLFKFSPLVPICWYIPSRVCGKKNVFVFLFNFLVLEKVSCHNLPRTSSWNAIFQACKNSAEYLKFLGSLIFPNFPGLKKKYFFGIDVGGSRQMLMLKTYLTSTNV